MGIEFQMMGSAFTLGLLVQTSIVAFIVILKGHIRTPFQDRRRLVLTIFLFFGALWALLTFANFFVKNVTACSITVIISTAMDQAARSTICGLLLWAVSDARKAPKERLAMQGLLAIRIGISAAYCGFTRPMFVPLCVPGMPILALGIATIAFDAVIIGTVSSRILQLGVLRRDMQYTRENPEGFALALTTLGFFIWSIHCIPQHIAAKEIPVYPRTATPAVGLIVFIAMIMPISGTVMLTRDFPAPTPVEIPPVSRQLNGFQQVGSPMEYHTSNQRGPLVVVNPSPRRETRLQSFQATMPRSGLSPYANRHSETNRSSAAVFQSIIGAPLSGAEPPISRNGQLPVPPKQTSPPKGVNGTNRNSSKPSDKKKPLLSLFASAGQSSGATKISGPVMDANGSQGPSHSATNFAVVDLKTAAEQQRQRQLLSKSIASGYHQSALARSAPFPTSMTLAEGLERSVSLKRKEIVQDTQSKELPVPALPNRYISNNSRSSLTASATTGSLPSPGADELRRRSPRTSIVQADSESSIGRPATRSFGLPRHPKDSHQIGELVPPLPRLEVNFNRSSAIQSTSSLASGLPQLPVPAIANKDSPYSPLFSPSGSSIMDRKRPSTSNELDRTIFPRRQSFKESARRSNHLKRVLHQSEIQSPPSQPKSGPVPTSAANLELLRPGSGGSELRFPAPPSRPSSAPLPLLPSPAPSVPRIPSGLFPPTPPLQSPEREMEGGVTPAAKSSCALCQSPYRPNPITPSPSSPSRAQEDNEVDSSQLFSADYRTPMFAANNEVSWLASVTQVTRPLQGPSMINVDDLKRSTSRNGENRKSQADRSSSTSASTMSNDSILSSTQSYLTSSVHGQGNMEWLEKEKGRRLPKEMFSRVEPIMENDGNYSSGSDYETEDPMDLGPEKRHSWSPNEYRTWHYRVGDPTPLFSERRKQKGSKTMAPPRSLLLRPVGRNATIVTRVSTRLGAEQQSLKEIQEELRKLDRTGRGSVGAMLGVPGNRLLRRSKAQSGVSDGQGSLLERIEREMNLQEKDWQKLQHNLDRNSTSSSEGSVTVDQTRFSLGSERSISERRRNSSVRTISQALSVSTESSENSHASMWQKRLAEAQIEYLEHAPTLLGNKNLNYLATINYRVQASPTPPESECTQSGSECESDTDSIRGDGSTQDSTFDPPMIVVTSLVPKIEPAQTASLWKPPVQQQVLDASPLWHLSGPSERAIEEAEPPAKYLRPTQRKQLNPLLISSTQLWAVTSPNGTKFSGLWGHTAQRPKSTAIKRFTQRPERRSKRVTFLPDIIESPRSIPGKDGALGVFQGPWGPSDSANPPMLLIPPITRTQNDGFYSSDEDDESSFFDDFDDDFSSDDGFDDSTLFEIGTMLHTRDIPSRDSLFPNRSIAITEDYDASDETDSGESRDDEIYEAQAYDAEAYGMERGLWVEERQNYTQSQSHLLSISEPWPPSVENSKPRSPSHDPQTSSSSPAGTVHKYAPTTARLLRQSNILEVNSKHLWTPSGLKSKVTSHASSNSRPGFWDDSPQQLPPRRMLWTRPSAVKQSQLSDVWASPSSSTKTSEEDHTVFYYPRRSKAHLVSTPLSSWTPGKLWNGQPKEEKSKRSGLWSGIKREVYQKPQLWMKSPVKTEAETVSGGLWTCASLKMQSQLASSVATISQPRKPRPAIPSKLPVLQTQHLWTPPSKSQLASKSLSHKTGMWSSNKSQIIVAAAAAAAPTPTSQPSSTVFSSAYSRPTTPSLVSPSSIRSGSISPTLRRQRSLLRQGSSVTRRISGGVAARVASLERSSRLSATEKLA